LKLEKNLQSKIIEDLEANTPHKCFSFKVSKANKNFIADLFVISHRGCFAVELKKENGIESPGQKNTREILNSFHPHIQAFVVSSWQEWVEIKKKYIFFSFL
jgi:hypothetical protein